MEGVAEVEVVAVARVGVEEVAKVARFRGVGQMEVMEATRKEVEEEEVTVVVVTRVAFRLQITQEEAIKVEVGGAIKVGGVEAIRVEVEVTNKMATTKRGVGEVGEEAVAEGVEVDREVAGEGEGGKTLTKVGSLNSSSSKVGISTTRQGSTKAGTTRAESSPIQYNRAHASCRHRELGGRGRFF